MCGIITFATNSPKELNPYVLIARGLMRIASHGGISHTGVEYLSHEAEESVLIKHPVHPWDFAEKLSKIFGSKSFPSCKAAIAHTAIVDGASSKFCCSDAQPNRSGCERLSLALTGDIASLDAIKKFIKVKNSEPDRSPSQLFVSSVGKMMLEGRNLKQALKDTCKKAGGSFCVAVMNRENPKEFYFVVYNEKAFFVRNKQGIFASSQTSPLVDVLFKKKYYLPLEGKSLLTLDPSLWDSKVTEEIN